MSKQLFEDGKVADINGNEFECVSVSYSELEGKRGNFTYGFRLKTEMDAEREAAKAGAEGEPVVEPTQTELNVEETQYVK